MEISKNITKTTKPFNNADETYNIKVKYDYCLKKSLEHVYTEIKNLFDNEKEKLYYKIEVLINAVHLNKNNKKIKTNKRKSDIVLYPTDLHEFNDILL